MRATGDKNGRARRAIAFDLAVLLGLVALFVTNLCLGSVGTTPAEVARILADGPGDASTAAQVIWQIRLPRAIEAVLLGGALSLSGFLLQTFFANPIADPFVLGVSSGAKLVVAVVMIVVLGAGQVMSPAASVASAFAGSLLTMGLVLLISRRVRSQSMLIVAGVMVGYICSAVTNFLIAFADDQSIVNLDNWSRGSFSGATWSDVALVAACVLAMGAAVFALSKPLGAYQLGEPYAQSVGVNVGALRLLIVAVSSLLSACVAAFAGPVSFVGIAAPHLAKRGVGSSRPLYVTPACLLTGAAFCCGCDLVARMLFSPVELSVSAVTAVFGAPVVIALMLRGRSRP
ncbi:FecCD family ABC transporter permease [Thermophilibacter sp.]|uniref:FecCD family ABC transporter permease n=1 Tax=Thermophilibacter sp. TaxID=2847309 RepID=UPI003A8E7F9A